MDDIVPLEDSGVGMNVVDDVIGFEDAIEVGITVGFENIVET